MLSFEIGKVGTTMRSKLRQSRIAQRLNRYLWNAGFRRLALWISVKTGAPVPMTEKFKDDLKTVILPLIAIGEDRKWHVCGTAFVVGASENQAIILTAAHVFDIPQRLDQPNPPQHTTAMFFVERNNVQLRRTYMRAIYSQSPTHACIPFVDKVWVCAPLDIAVGLVRLSDEDVGKFRFQNRLAIDTRPPVLNEEIAVVGYGSMDVVQPDQIEDGSLINFAHKLEWREGAITEVFPSRGPRNESMACFQVDVPIDSGMSGGPIIRKSHSDDLVVCGIAGKDESHPVYPEKGSGQLALGWPLFQAMATNIEIRLQGGMPQNAIFLDLIRLGVVDERGGALQNIRFVAKPNNEGTVVQWIGAAPPS